MALDRRGPRQSDLWSASPSLMNVTADTWSTCPGNAWLPRPIFSEKWRNCSGVTPVTEE
jgi:hypothetical protein